MSDKDLPSLIKATVGMVFEVSAAFVENKSKIDDLRKQADALEEANKAVMQRFNDCYTTANLFGFDLDAECQRYWSNSNAIAANTYGPSEAPPSVAALASVHSDEKITIQGFVTKAAEAAFPNPVRASDLRKELEERGIKTHEKTVGMTLYRLSQKGILERRGKANWFFVPEPLRLSAQAQEQEGPGDHPGLLQLAE